jgi:hypothetical protein
MDNANAAGGVWATSKWALRPYTHLPTLFFYFLCAFWELLGKSVAVRKVQKHHRKEIAKSPVSKTFCPKKRQENPKPICSPFLYHVFRLF